MLDPHSTYRIQFHKKFTFSNLREIVSYLNELGIKTIYASPIFEAVPGSMHGYDVVNPNKINPEIGTLEELRSISKELKALGMRWIQDIVPNHMGFHQNNQWLMDILKNGEASIYRRYFDIVSQNLDNEPLMVPFLGDSLEEVIGKGELQLELKGKGAYLKYNDSLWPVRDDMTGDLQSMEPADIAKAQYYRLCSHRETNQEINYRRFFTVNNLICLNIQPEEVFNEYHLLTKLLLEEGIIDGLRIDHVDGLADPTAYLFNLRNLCGDSAYIVVEKILAPGEQLNVSWPIQGTTGYDYLGLVNQLFTNQKAEKKFDNYYADLGRTIRSVEKEVLRKKRAFLESAMQGELENLYQLFLSLNLLGKYQTDPAYSATLPLVKDVIAELLIRFPVYRFYSSSYPLSAEDADNMHQLFDDIEQDKKFEEAVQVMRNILLEGKGLAKEDQDKAMIFYRRLMQFTGPLMAKGVEDTLMYTYNRFIGNNEVGDSPELFGITTDEFHEQITLRQKHWPLAMNASATHDTKRGEDARARLAVLTDLRGEWIAEVKEWCELNQELKTDQSPDQNDEYFIYQTLIATFPEGIAEDENYTERLLDYIEKALRESKRMSAWDDPNFEYEKSTKDFILKLFDPQREFWSRFSVFHQKVASLGRTVSLCALVLKHTLPGVPDTYQGAELWDLSMVDPDNRRPVDYRLREGMLAKNKDEKIDMRRLWNNGSDGCIKIHLLQTLLKTRNEHSQLFSEGSYIPLEVKGKKAGNVCAFARKYQGKWLVCVIPLNPCYVGTETVVDYWEDTRVCIPEGLPISYHDIMANQSSNIKKDESGDRVELQLAELFDDIPLAVLLFNDSSKPRSAGVLMHISSLPSPYGIGDFGSSARNFLQLLAEHKFRHWQVLPMNPLSPGQLYSPYSATSVMAGNVLLISPEELQKDGLLNINDLKAYKCKIKRNITYEKAFKLKSELLGKAYQSSLSTGASKNASALSDFCEQEAYWLDDYVLYTLFQRLNEGKAWHQWPDELKNREKQALAKVLKKYSLELDELRWQQYIFFQQWKRLRADARSLGISIIGDLPFYASMDSSDVWTHRSLFSVDRTGQIDGVAGVPPDYFNEEGQLWGMPVYNWNAMAKNDYQWWIQRIAKNAELYDTIRLDHFRAFSSYWEIPAGSDSAKSGSWKPGPGADFFKALFSKVKNVKIIAEDLGEISEEVFQLRDQFAMPGMKVLQFAFGDDNPTSIHAPHNYENTNCVVYTGTHDNNTTRGWYADDANSLVKSNLEEYIGKKISEKSISIEMIRLALKSTAQIAIIPMQDILNKSTKSRMNTPASTSGNWKWRLKPEELKPGKTIKKIRKYLEIYGR